MLGTSVSVSCRSFGIVCGVYLPGTSRVLELVDMEHHSLQHDDMHGNGRKWKPQWRIQG